MAKHTIFALVWTTVSVAVMLWFAAVMVDCGSVVSTACDAAIYETWRDLWRLRWIFNYKELIAGFAAAGAAGLVLVSTKAQLSEQRRADADRRKDLYKSTITLMAYCFHVAAFGIYKGQIEESDLNIFDEIEYEHEFISRFGMFVADTKILAINCRRAMKAVCEYNTDPSSNKKDAQFFGANHSQRISAVKAKIMSDVCRKYLKTDLSIDIADVKIKENGVISLMMKDYNLSPDQLTGSQGFVVWKNND